MIARSLRSPSPLVRFVAMSSAPAKEEEEEKAEVPRACDNCKAAATVRFTPLDGDEIECCGECLLPDEGVLTLCKAACPNFAFIVCDYNAAGTEATVETDDQLECAQCGKGYHCVRALPQRLLPAAARGRKSSAPSAAFFPLPRPLCPPFLDHVQGGSGAAGREEGVSAPPQARPGRRSADNTPRRQNALAASFYVLCIHYISSALLALPAGARCSAVVERR